MFKKIKIDYLNFDHIKILFNQKLQSKKISDLMTDEQINNFENTVTNDRYFSSCGHLNNEGAIIYTNHIINTFFK
mgnify:CR=1 FL=1